MPSSLSLLRAELAARNAAYARRLKLAHVISHGQGRVVVYPPAPTPDGTDADSHGNFLTKSYAAILANEAWRKRLLKVHAQAKRALPRLETPQQRRWCELDSSNSSDALLMNIFCYPGLLQSREVCALLDVSAMDVPHFGVKPRVPRTGTTGDATELDMRLGNLIVEAKLTESNFQQRDAAAVERYLNFNKVFDRDVLPRAKPKMKLVHDHDLGEMLIAAEPGKPLKYASYQMIRNILAAYALDCRLCVLIHACRTDLREQYHAVLRAVRDADLRTRCTLLTWQELAAAVPPDLREFLAEKYGIVAG